MAQLGAVGVWANALKDQAGAVKAYRKALVAWQHGFAAGPVQGGGRQVRLRGEGAEAAVELIEGAIAEIERGR